MNLNMGLRMAVLNEGKKKTPYSRVLIDTFSASEVWPLVDIASGTTITAKVNTARNGVLSGWTLQNAAGPVSGTLAPYINGSTGYGEIKSSNGSTGLTDIFNGQEGSIMAWAMVEDASVWSEANMRYLWSWDITTANYTQLYKHSTVPNRLIGQRVASETNSNINYNSSSPLGWNLWGLSWTKSGDSVRLYLNGTQVGNTPTGLGDWQTGVFSKNKIFAHSVDDRLWKGWGAYFAVKFGAAWTQPEYAAIYAAAATAGPG